ncbi:MAG: hypothetical protein L0Z62_04455 [Gemmataceae bacterium]|nr:hypothetical protein [Gemmataceae bacterium]
MVRFEPRPPSAFAHHTKSWFGLEIEINEQPFPDGMFDHAVLLGGMVLMAYGAFALLRDVVRWRRARKARQAASAG